MTIAQLDDDIANIKATASTEVEFDGNSLATVISDMRDLEQEGRILGVADIAALQAIVGTEAALVAVKAGGIFYWADTAEQVIYYDAPDGKWNLLPIDINTLFGVDLTALADGNVLAYHSADQSWRNAVLNVLWANIGNKPTTISGYGIVDNIVTTTAAGTTVLGSRQPGGSGTIDTNAFINITINGVGYKLALIS